MHKQPVTYNLLLLTHSFISLTCLKRYIILPSVNMPNINYLQKLENVQMLSTYHAGGRTRVCPNRTIYLNISVDLTENISSFACIFVGIKDYLRKQ